MRFETATRERPTRRPSSSRVRPELLDEQRAGARLLDRVQVLAGHVLDQRELERLLVVVRAHDGGHGLEARELRGAPAALAGDQLVGPAGDRADEHGLQHAALGQRVRQRLQRRLVEGAAAAGAGSGAISSTGIWRRSPGRRARVRVRRGGRRQDRRQAAAHAARAQPRAATSFASSKYASDPAQCGSWWMTGAAEARRLAEPDVARDHGVEDQRGEVPADLGLHVLARAWSARRASSAASRRPSASG